MKVKVVTKYESGHSYVSHWSPDTIYCPECGEKEVWAENDPGDYYVGPDYVCIACGSSFTIQGPDDGGYTIQQAVDQIRMKKESL